MDVLNVSSKCRVWLFVAFHGLHHHGQICPYWVVVRISRHWVCLLQLVTGHITAPIPAILMALSFALFVGRKDALRKRIFDEADRNVRARREEAAAFVKNYDQQLNTNTFHTVSVRFIDSLCIFCVWVATTNYMYYWLLYLQDFPNACRAARRAVSDIAILMLDMEMHPADKLCFAINKVCMELDKCTYANHNVFDFEGGLTTLVAIRDYFNSSSGMPSLDVMVQTAIDLTFHLTTLVGKIKRRQQRKQRRGFWYGLCPAYTSTSLLRLTAVYPVLLCNTYYLYMCRLADKWYMCQCASWFC